MDFNLCRTKFIISIHLFCINKQGKVCVCVCWFFLGVFLFFFFGGGRGRGSYDRVCVCVCEREREREQIYHIWNVSKANIWLTGFGSSKEGISFQNVFDSYPINWLGFKTCLPKSLQLKKKK